jgi:hypothetical protein
LDAIFLAAGSDLECEKFIHLILFENRFKGLVSPEFSAKYSLQKVLDPAPYWPPIGLLLASYYPSTEPLGILAFLPVSSSI